jgi:hypothetical protein
MQRAFVSRLVVLGIAGVLLGSVAGGLATAAEQEKKAKKPKAMQQAKKPTTKSGKPVVEQPTYRSAELAIKPKGCFGITPKVEKVMPDEGKAGDKVTITGKNFGAADCVRTVSFGPGHEAKFHYQNETKIETTVPSGGRKGLVILTVTTASGEDSKPFLVK